MTWPEAFAIAATVLAIAAMTITVILKGRP
jgi:hypothetical protein